MGYRKIQYIKIENFRNIGHDSKKAQEDSDSKKGIGISDTLHICGPLITIIGENNCGKSNVLDAFAILGGSKELSQEDKPMFFGHKGDPKITANIESLKDSDFLSGKNFMITINAGAIPSAAGNNNGHKQTGARPPRGGGGGGVSVGKTESFIQHLKESLTKGNVFAVYEEVNAKPRIKLFLEYSKEILSISKDRNTLSCFSVKSFSDENDKDLPKDLPLACTFHIIRQGETAKQPDIKPDPIDTFIECVKNKGELKEYPVTKELSSCDDNNNTQPPPFNNPVDYESIRSQVEQYLDSLDSNKIYIIKEGDRFDILNCIKRLMDILTDITNAQTFDFYFIKNAYDEIRRLYKELADYINYLKEKSSRYFYGSTYDRALEKYMDIVKPLESVINLLKDSLELYLQAEEKARKKLKREGQSRQTSNSDDVPNITYYKQKVIKDSDLKIGINDLDNSEFFNILFRILGDETKDKAIMGCENDVIRKNSREHIEQNMKEKVCDIFNDLYCDGKPVYSFELELESICISFVMKKDKEGIKLSRQSEGFKKFFNFFFHFLYAKPMNQGDIVLIDEAETRLSIPAQREFAKFLRDFGARHGITFIITTHSPYMLDIDHLNDVRILRSASDGGRSLFVNNFSFINSHEADTLKGIRDALGADISIDNKVIFVEGVTDYNYLSAFKIAYNKDKKEELNISFIPISGVCTNDEDQREKIDKLLSFMKDTKIYNAILLVDDDPAGKAMKSNIDQLKHEKNPSLPTLPKEMQLKVVSLYDAFKESSIEKNYANESDIEIETLFKKDELEHFKLYKEPSNKGSKNSNKFKHYIIEHVVKGDSMDYVSEETKQNFYNLLEYLHKLKEKDSTE